MHDASTLREQLAHLRATSGLPELGPRPRPGVRPLPDLQKAMDDCLRRTSLPAASKNLIRAVVLLWHDHLDAAHGIAQEDESADGSYVHGLMHRREPDYGNAKYWFRRVGRHVCFGELAERAGELLRSTGETELGRRLIPAGGWDPYAMVDACERGAARGGGSADLLRRIQAIEFELLLERFSASSVSSR